VPHGADVERVRAGVGPERALVVREAGLDQRVVQRGRHHPAPGRRTALDPDPAHVVAPGRPGTGAYGAERGRPLPALALPVPPGLLAAAQREPEPHLDRLAR